MKIFTATLLTLAATLTIALFITTKKVDLDASANIRNSLKSSDNIHVYEGLPHQTFEAAQLKEETKRTDTTEIGKFPFYTPKQTPPEEAAHLLREVLVSANSLLKFSGEKRCGGFHPDYAVAWTVDDVEYAALICYGCHEVLFVGGRDTYRYDLKDDALRRLKKLLAPFAKKRLQQSKG